MMSSTKGDRGSGRGKGKNYFFVTYVQEIFFESGILINKKVNDNSFFKSSFIFIAE